MTWPASGTTCTRNVILYLNLPLTRERASHLNVEVEISKLILNLLNSTRSADAK
jgi:hypothetical protein